MTDYQKHSVTTDALDTLGTIIDANQGRDAIHLAVEPCRAAEALYPGHHVKFNTDGAAVYANRITDTAAVGIVDPFLTESVRPGEWFWLVVYPRQITSLRHVWEHPAFPSPGETTTAPVDTDKEAVRSRLTEWVTAADVHMTFDMLIELAESGFVSIPEDDYGSLRLDDESLHSSGWDAYGNIPGWVWDDVATYIGQEPVGRPSYFSCSC